MMMSLCYSIVYHSNGVQWYEQSVDWIGLDLAWFSCYSSMFRAPLYLRSSWCDVYFKNIFVTFFTLPSGELSMV